MSKISQFKGLSINISENNESLAEHLFAKIYPIIASKTEGETFNIAISGGSLINILATIFQKHTEKLNLSSWRVYFCDERLVALDHADSNYGQFIENVIQPLKKTGITVLPEIFPISEDISDFKKVSCAYESLLPSNKHFDLILLGCGPDGHTCSLFPGDAHKYLLENVDEKAVLHCEDSPKPPSDRITFTLKTLSWSDRLWYVATGAGKKSIFKEIFGLDGEPVNLNLPCSIINKEFTNKVEWFVDEASTESTELGN
ncbi:hypothetical protein QEN19_002694 [Hanseniaspora menglaensis]